MRFDFFWERDVPFAFAEARIGVADVLKVFGPFSIDFDSQAHAIDDDTQFIVGRGGEMHAHLKAVVILADVNAVVARRTAPRIFQIATKKGFHRNRSALKATAVAWFD